MYDKHFRKVSKWGQVTIPADIRRLLKLNPGDTVEISVDVAGTLRIERSKYPTVASLRGAAGSIGRNLSKAEMMAIVREERAEVYARKAQRGNA